MKLRDAVSRDGLLDLLGRVFYAAKATVGQGEPRTALLNAAALLDGDNAAAPELSAAALEAAARGDAAARGGLLRSCFAVALRLVRDAAALESGRDVAWAEALRIVRDAMRSAGLYVAPNVVSAAASADAANVGDAWIAVQTVAEDGLPGPDWLPQSLAAEFRGGSARLTSSAARPAWSPDWPGGSEDDGAAIPTYTMTGELIDNAEFAVGAGGPFASWTAVGSGIDALEPPQDEIRFSAPPTGGYFRLKFTNRLGLVRITGDLPYDAPAYEIGRALAALDRETRGVQCVRKTTGYDFVLDWPSGRHDLPVPVAENFLTGASVSVVRVRAGVAGGYAGRAARMSGDGVSLCGLFQPIRLDAAGAGIAIVRVLHNGAAAGTLQIGLFAQADAAAPPISGPNGHVNAGSFSLASLAASQYHILTVPLAWPAETAAYFGLRLSSPVTAGKYAALARPQFLRWPTVAYRPALALIRERFGPREGDRFTVTVSNDLGGEFLTWWLRAFGPAVLPPRGGGTLVPDSILAP